MSRSRGASEFGRGLRLASLLLMAAPMVAAQAPEYQIKAAFLYNFARFVEWPEEAFAGREEFVLGVLGTDPFGSEIEHMLVGKQVQGRPLVLRRMTSVKDALRCHLVFVGVSEGQRLEGVLGALAHLPVLTVADVPRFNSRGGMIQLVLIDNRVRFGINAPAAARAGLRVSSHLLRLAVPPEGEGRP